MEYDCHMIKNFGFRSKNQVFRIKNFEILGFSHLEFEILGISNEIPSISKSVGFRSYLRIHRILGKYYTPVNLDQQ